MKTMCNPFYPYHFPACGNSFILVKEVAIRIPLTDHTSLSTLLFINLPLLLQMLLSVSSSSSLPGKNLFRDVGAGLLIHLLVPVIHLQQEAMRWLQERNLGPYGAHQVSVRTTRAEKPGPFRRILMQVLGDWLLKEVPTLEPV